MLNIRAATGSDARAIIGFWNPLIRDSAVTFASRPKTEADIVTMIDACRAERRAFLVAELGGEVVGFATYGQFRRGDGYVRTMESTIILAHAA